MGKDKYCIAIDSNSFTYVIDALESIDGPAEEPKDEKLALFRIYLHLPGSFHISPTVELEFGRIRDEAKRILHQSWFDSHFLPFVPAPDTKLVQNRVLELSAGFSPKNSNDCSVLAECELHGIKVLLTYDTWFLKHLARRSTTVRVLSPTAYWSEMGIPFGAKPSKVPRGDNPMGKVSWWRW